MEGGFSKVEQYCTEQQQRIQNPGLSSNIGCATCMTWGKLLNLRWLSLSSCVKGKIAFTSEKAMAPHSSTLAWKTPWMEEPGRRQAMGSLGVGHV